MMTSELSYLVRYSKLNLMDQMRIEQTLKSTIFCLFHFFLKFQKKCAWWVHIPETCSERTYTCMVSSKIKKRLCTKHEQKILISTKKIKFRLFSHLDPTWKSKISIFCVPNVRQYFLTLLFETYHYRYVSYRITFT